MLISIFYKVVDHRIRTTTCLRPIIKQNQLYGRHGPTRWSRGQRA